jgi:peptidoglycan hydrolase-like protein with peptidoglycan-binding domain
MGRVGGIDNNNVSFENFLHRFFEETPEISKSPAFIPQSSYAEKVGFNSADFMKANLAQSVSPLDAVSESRLAKVNPELASRIRAMAADLKAQGIDIRVTDGLRTVEEQNALYEQGRTKPGNIVTNARGGSSYHNYGLAVDVVPMVNGKANYNVSADTWNKIGAAGKKYGLEWGGDFKSIVDKPHFQMSGGAGRARDWLPTYQQGGLQAVWDKANQNTPPIGNLPPAPPTTTPPTTGTPPINSTDSVRFGSRGESVRQLQQQLQKLGYNIKDDGIFGPKTDAAVKDFQRKNSLKVDGIVGPKTRAALDRATTTVPTARLQRGANGEQVKQLQDALVKLGYMTKDQISGGGYGKFGPRTDAALRRFQSDKGLVSDGIYGPKTKNALRTALGRTTPTTPVNPTNPTATTASAAKINDILKGTNLAGKGELISQLAKKYNIPAELALAMFRMEAGFATNGSLAQRNNNPGNIRFNNQEGATRGAGGFAKWDSMDKGIEAYFKLLDRGYRSFIDSKDWSGLVNKYAPPIENDSRAYTRNIVNWMEDYRNIIS